MRKIAEILLIFAALAAIYMVAYAQVEQGTGGGTAAGGASQGSAVTNPGGGGGDRAGGGRGLMRMDTNADGVISKDEWRGSEESFKAIDTNGDGKIDAAEMAAMRERFQQMRRPRGEEAPEGPGGPAAPGAAREMDDSALATQLRAAARVETLIFRMMDTNGDGKITKQELDDFSARLMAADTDKDGSVSVDEARKAVAGNLAKRFSERFMKRFDKNADGKVTADEFGGNEDVFKRLDANGDSSITSDDFTLLANKWLESPEAQQDRGGPAAGNAAGPRFGTGRGPGGGRFGGPRRGGNIESTGAPDDGGGSE